MNTQNINNCLGLVYTNRSLSRFGNGNIPSTFLTPKIKQCLGLIYINRNLSRFGKKNERIMEKDFNNCVWTCRRKK